MILFLNESSVEKLTGGVADGKTIYDIAKKHNVSIKNILKQLKKGIKIELEHTNSSGQAREIALDHLFELPDYYDRLEQIETNK